MEFIIDRFEENFAVLIDENDNIINVLKNMLPSEIKEGDVLAYYDGSYTVNKNKTDMLRKANHDLLNSLWK